MRLQSLLLVGLSAIPLIAAVPTSDPNVVDATTIEELPTANPDAVDDLALEALQNLQAFANVTESDVTKRGGPKCSLRNIAVRREWSTLSKKERVSYTNAIKCLMAKPSKSDKSKIPGAKSRYDDFVAVHIQQTPTCHQTANFLSWHRWYTWVFEKALRDECGYRGYQPYWNWGRTAQDPASSDVFDGSPYSLGGNGDYIPHGGSKAGGGQVSIPPGNGGGCVTKGPFKDMTVNLGPISPTLEGVTKAPGDGMSYNPRCLRRDLNPYVSQKWTNTHEILRLITTPRDIYDFQKLMGGDYPKGFLGVHSGGHYTIGGDPGGDFFNSPADPAFWVHHGMIDRVWWIWQMMDPTRRPWQLYGTLTLNNNPPTRNGTLDDTIELGVNAPDPIKLRDLMMTTDGPFCYIYL